MQLTEEEIAHITARRERNAKALALQRRPA